MDERRSLARREDDRVNHRRHAAFRQREAHVLEAADDAAHDLLVREVRARVLRLRDVKTLRQVWSTQDWRDALEENYARSKRGLPPFMVIKKIKSEGLLPRTGFFDPWLSQAFAAEAMRQIREDFETYVLKRIDAATKKAKADRSIIIRL